MHAEARDGFERMLVESGLDTSKPWRVLDVGGQDVNGTVYDLLPNARISVLDMHPLPGRKVDIVADASTWRGDLFDVVMSTEGLEHMAQWRAVVETMAAALDPAGPSLLLLTCASTGRQPHGMLGAPLPVAGEYYRNVVPADLRRELMKFFQTVRVEHRAVPGDAYAWAQVEPVLDIAVVIPTIPERVQMLERALASVQGQSLAAREIVVAEDTVGLGPSASRNRAIASSDSEWVAFLDDDDEFEVDHLLELALATRSGADLIWPWFTVKGGSDPFPQHFGRGWDPQDPHQIPITFLVRREAGDQVGWFSSVPDGVKHPDGNRAGEDWRFTLALSAAGRQLLHVPKRTWVWHHHGKNTSGLPKRRRS